MPDPFNLGVAGAAQEIRDKILSPVSLAESLLDRIDSLDPALKAWVTIDREEVISTARELEKELDEKGPRGPLHGVPVGLKDIFYTEGMLTAAGSRIYSDFVPKYDAATVTKIKEAGGIILGKTATTEFAMADPSPTINPWNKAHTPGGSSSGSSVAVATRMCAAALGTQTAGSTCRPAAYNGIVGFKATYGRISRYGVVPLSWSMDTVGILVRSVLDAAVMLQAMAGYDENDPGCANVAVPNYLEEMDKLSGPPRIGLIREFYSDRSSAEVWKNTEDVAQRLAQAGAEIAEISLPESFETAHDCQVIVSNVECASFHEQWHRDRADDYGPKIRASIEVGMLIPGIRYVQAQRLRRQFRRDMVEMLRHVDAVITPSFPVPAPFGLDSTGDPVFQQPWSFSGLPSIAVPSGLSGAGLPLSVQFGGLPFKESTLLAAARWCESALGIDLSPPEFS